MAQAKEKLPPPEGTRPMMISMREMESLALKTGSGLRETVEYKVFNKAEIMEQITQMGFMCPFHEFRVELAVSVCACVCVTCVHRVGGEKSV